MAEAVRCVTWLEMRATWLGYFLWIRSMSSLRWLYAKSRSMSGRSVRASCMKRLRAKLCSIGSMLWMPSRYPMRLHPADPRVTYLYSGARSSIVRTCMNTSSNLCCSISLISLAYLLAYAWPCGSGLRKCSVIFML